MAVHLKNKEELINKAHDVGYTSEAEYGGCAQCTLVGVFDALGIVNPGLIRAATGFAAGGGKMNDGVCGGYAGGIMAISLLFGRKQEEMGSDLSDKIKTNELTVKLRQTFIREYGSVTCKDIHKEIFGRNYNMWCPTEIEQFNADGAHTEKCTSVVGKAAAATVRTILDEAEMRGMTLDDIREMADEY